MKILLIGYGKMGKVIEKSAEKRGWQVIHIIDQPKQWQELPAGIDPDVAIEFSEPGSVLSNIEKCFEHGIPIVCGTTGWYSHLAEVKQMAEERQGSMLYAPNFSKGMNIFFALNRWITESLDVMSNYHVSIKEFHHQHKLDAPSGTALKLVNDIIATSKRYKTWSGSDTSDPTKVPVTSIRNGEIPGTHYILWDSPEDSIRIIHEAKSRHMFAEGALDAAAWLIGKKGVFTFEQMLFPSMEQSF